MSNQKPHTITAYTFQAGTPVTDLSTNSLVENFYSNIFFENFLKLIISSKNNKHRDGTNYFHLVSLKQSSDADVLEGKIHTTKYGILSEIIDTDTDTVVNRVEPEQGVKNEINFVINKKNGIIIIQNDPFRIISRSFLYEFLKKRENLTANLVKTFNQNNPSHILYDAYTFTLTTIHDTGFYDQLAKIHNIKSISVNTIVERPSVNAALNQFTKSGTPPHLLLSEVTDLTYTFKNSIRNNGVKRVKEFVQKALDLEKVDSVVAEGQGLKAEFKIKPQKHLIKTTKNEKGILDQSKIIDQMIDLVKVD